jgi:hypothetical protein
LSTYFEASVAFYAYSTNPLCCSKTIFRSKPKTFSRFCQTLTWHTSAYKYDLQAVGHKYIAANANANANANTNANQHTSALILLQEGVSDKRTIPVFISCSHAFLSHHYSETRKTWSIRHTTVRGLKGASVLHLMEENYLEPKTGFKQVSYVRFSFLWWIILKMFLIVNSQFLNSFSYRLC